MKRFFFLRFLLFFLALSTSAFSAKVKVNRWDKGLRFEEYLQKFNIDKNIIDTLDREDQALISEIGYTHKYYELIASNGVLLQSLIPIGEELQAHLFRTHTGYKLEIIPIAYQKDTYIAIISIDKSPSYDIIRKTKNRRLANEFTRLLKHSVDFRGVQKGDKIVIVYDQKMRLGQPLGVPDIKVAMLESNGKKNYVFKYSDGKYYNANGKALIEKYMGKPLNRLIITSPFTTRRWHPIQHKWKAHHGIDCRARRGTPILAAADGKVVYSGWMSGYGRVIKIQHADNYLTLYAHQSRLKAKVGQLVKKGDIIGYTGNSGRSTGPHLHFGLYKDGRPINPMRLVKFTTDGLTGKDRENFLNRKRKYTKIINKIEEENLPSYVWNTVNDIYVLPKMKTYYQNRGW